MQAPRGFGETRDLPYWHCLWCLLGQDMEMKFKKMKWNDILQKGKSEKSKSRQSPWASNVTPEPPMLSCPFPSR